MGALVESSHQDVRKFLAESLANAESLAFDEYGFDLLIDEDPNVRAALFAQSVHVSPVG